MFRTLDEYEFENQGTLIDVVNNAHKRELFEDIDELRIMNARYLIYETKITYNKLKKDLE
jgi:hypothetical protein